MTRILNHLTVRRDGMHNAFPDLTYWQGAYWISFRRSERHHFCPAARLVFVVSADKARWQEASSLKLPGDMREAQFVPLGERRIAAIFSTVCRKPDAPGGRLLQCHAAFTNDLYRWEEPVPILDPCHNIFRVHRREGRFYATATHMPGEERRLHFIVSDDLLRWETLAVIGPPEDRINESDFHFLPDGEVWMVSRTKRPGEPAWFCRARPPYTEWELTDLQTRIHAPKIIAHKGRLYVAGRCLPEMLGETAWPFGHSLCVWELTRGKVEPVLRLPAAGDCAYCGLIEDPDGRLCMAYYSQHAYYLGVTPPYGARVVPDAALPPRTEREGYAADIYFAEIELLPSR